MGVDLVLGCKGLQNLPIAGMERNEIHNEQ